jgi:glutamate dehydrogenase
VTRGLFSAMDIIDISHKKKMSIALVAEIYFGIGEYLDITWIRNQVISHSAENNWESLSREALRDDLDWQQRQLTDGLIAYDSKDTDLRIKLESWGDAHSDLMERWRSILLELKSSTGLNYTMFFVAIRELIDLSQTTLQIYSKS